MRSPCEIFGGVDYQYQLLVLVLCLNYLAGSSLYAFLPTFSIALNLACRNITPHLHSSLNSFCILNTMATKPDNF